MAEAKKKVTTKKTKTEEKAQLEEIIKIDKTAVEAEAKEIVAEIKKESTKSPLAKAGKRSAKAVAEEEAAKAKQERKASKAKLTEKLKTTQKMPRTTAERAGKKYREVYKLVDSSKIYTLNEAMEVVCQTSTTKFDSSVELHIRLGVDPKLADQNVRGTVVLPAGTGKNPKIAVICEAKDEKAAKAAGAELVGADIVFALLDKEQLAFDVLVTAPTQMAKLGKYARLLGPRGLMPSPKAGTVNTDVVKAVAEAKAGKVEYRVDSNGIIHLSVGKVSFGSTKLIQNAQIVLASVKSAKPASLKGNYITSIYTATTMGPSVKIAAD